MGNKHNEHITEEIARKLLTFDQEACFESIKKQMLERINLDYSNKTSSRTIEEYISQAEALTCFYFCDHNIPYVFYTVDYIGREYPDLVLKIRQMVEVLVTNQE